MTPCLVVLTDFFAVSNRALSYAAGLAVPFNAHLLLLHVRQDELLAPGGYTQQGGRNTSFALGALATAQTVPTEVDISEALLPDAVREAIAHRHPLLLVLGRPGAADAPADLTAHTAMGLLRDVPHPLLVVPTAGWDAFPPRRLLLAVDGAPFSLDDQQEVVSQLLHATHGTLAVMHVTDDHNPRPDGAAVLATVWANDLANAVLSDSLHEVYNPSVVDGILKEAARQQADMLVVVARRHSLLGSLFHESVTALLLQQSPIPVLVLPAEE